MTIKFLLWFSCLIGLNFASEYIVFGPKSISAGGDAAVSLSLLKPQATAQVTVDLFSGIGIQEAIIATAAATVSYANSPQLITLRVPVNVSNKWRMNVKCTGGVNFNRDYLGTSVVRKQVSVLVQTDKELYKPSQTVNFRVLLIDKSLRPSGSVVDVMIKDNAKNIVRQWLKVSNATGVLTFKFELSDQPVLGEWSINVKSVDNLTTVEGFTVEKYVLPRFKADITIDKPFYTYDPGQLLSGEVAVKYTYGKGVVGRLQVSATTAEASCGGAYTWDVKQRLTVARFLKMEEGSTGSHDFDFKFSEVIPSNAFSTSRSIYPQSCKLLIVANATDAITSKTQSATTFVDVYNYDMDVNFPETNPQTYKRGLTYVGYAQVTKPDGSPMDATDSRRINITAYYGYGSDSSVPKPWNKIYSIPTDGLLKLEIPVPEAVVEPTATTADKQPVPDSGDAIFFPRPGPSSGGMTQLRIAAEYAITKESSSIVKREAYVNDEYKSENKAGVQLSLPGGDTPVVVGSQLDVALTATHAVDVVYYQVMSAGAIVASGSAAATVTGGTSFRWTIPVQKSMAPSARLVAWAVYLGEVVVDVTTFTATGIFDNEVSLSFETPDNPGERSAEPGAEAIPSAQPGQDAKLNIVTRANSLVGVLAVDQSVLILKSGNDLTEDKILTELASYESGSSGGDDFDDIMPFRMGWWMPWSNGKDANETLENAKLVVLTDCLVYKEPPEKFLNYMNGLFSFMMEADGDGERPAVFMRGQPGPVAAAQPPSPKQSSPASAPGIRKEFPESWLWSDLRARSDGTASLTTTVPDTITTWIATAFSLSPQHGLAVSDNPAKIRVFRPFFISLTLPYSLVRGEQFALQVSCSIIKRRLPWRKSFWPNRRNSR